MSKSPETPEKIPEGKSFCNVPHTLALAANAGLSQWPAGTQLTFGIVRPVRGFTKLSMQRVIEECYRPWHECCGLPPVQWTEILSSASVLVGVRKIDGAYGVLAEAELPPPGAARSDFQLRMWFDSRDTFDESLTPAKGRIAIVPVGRHEAGHTMGLGHSEDEVKNALMYRYMSDLVDLQEWDVIQMQLRYGKPEVKPAPTVKMDWEELAKLLERAAQMIREHAPAAKP